MEIESLWTKEMYQSAFENKWWITSSFENTKIIGLQKKKKKRTIWGLGGEETCVLLYLHFVV